jgi:hypothetical protein
MNEHIKNAIYLVIGMLTLSGMIWGVSEYLHTFIRRPEFTVRLEKLNDRCTTLENRLNKLSERRLHDPIENP